MYPVTCSDCWRIEVNKNYEQGTTKILEMREALLKYLSRYKGKMITTTGTI